MDFGQVFREPPPCPWTKIKSISGSDGTWSKFSPSGPLESSGGCDCSLRAGLLERCIESPFKARSRKDIPLSAEDRLLYCDRRQVVSDSTRTVD